MHKLKHCLFALCSPFISRYVLWKSAQENLPWRGLLFPKLLSNEQKYNHGDRRTDRCSAIFISSETQLSPLELLFSLPPVILFGLHLTNCQMKTRIHTISFKLLCSFKVLRTIISPWKLGHGMFSIEFFTNSPQHKGVNIANFVLVMPLKSTTPIKHLISNFTFTNISWCE